MTIKENLETKEKEGGLIKKWMKKIILPNTVLSYGLLTSNYHHKSLNNFLTEIIFSKF